MREKAMLLIRSGAIVLSLYVCLPAVSWAGGWYLMVAPPKNSKSEHKPDLSVPLKLWDQRASFDSAKACESRRLRELASHTALVGAASVAPNDPFDETLIDATEQYLLHSDSSKIPAGMIGPISRAVLNYQPGYLCIASDDPRLK